jgi:hypothetical protein
MPQFAYQLVIDRGSRTGDHKSSCALLYVVIGWRLDAKTRRIDDDLNLSRYETYLVTQSLWQYHTACLIDGGTHTITIPYSMGCRRADVGGIPWHGSLAGSVEYHGVLRRLYRPCQPLPHLGLVPLASSTRGFGRSHQA